MIIDYRDAPPHVHGPGAAGDECGNALDAGGEDVAWADDAVSDSPEVRECPVGASGHGQRLDRFLVSMAQEFSRSHLQVLIDDGLVRVDGSVALTASRRLRVGQRVRVELRPTAESLAFRPERMPLPIVHEDAHLLVIDKPAGWVVHPAAGHWSGTLLNGLLAHHGEAARLPRAGIVHRLDKDTSGLMVVGKTLPAVTALVRSIAAREVRRTYLALAHGHLPLGQRSVDAPVGRDPSSRLRMAVHAAGRPALTRIECLGTGEGVSRLVCRLHTGRTHQIRVHAASLGHPLVGDVLYGGRPAWHLRRQALHAAQLALAHPHNGHWMCFRSPLPTDLDEAWRASGGSLPVDLETDAQPFGMRCGRGLA